MSQSIYNVSVQKINGQSTTLGEYKGHALLIVNVASKCGLTPQYDGLEKLQKKYGSQGFEVLGFPANEFGAQEPGTNEEIQKFCRLSYGVEFPMFSKIVVKGAGQHALYKELIEAQPKPLAKPESSFQKKIAAAVGAMDILWNFEKFVVNRQGDVVARFAPDIAPEDPLLVEAIERAL